MNSETYCRKRWTPFPIRWNVGRQWVAAFYRRTHGCSHCLRHRWKMLDALVRFSNRMCRKSFAISPDRMRCERSRDIPHFRHSISCGNWCDESIWTCHGYICCTPSTDCCRWWRDNRGNFSNSPRSTLDEVSPPIRIGSRVEWLDDCRTIDWSRYADPIVGTHRWIDLSPIKSIIRLAT